MSPALLDRKADARRAIAGLGVSTRMPNSSHRLAPSLSKGSGVSGVPSPTRASPSRPDQSYSFKVGSGVNRLEEGLNVSRTDKISGSPFKSVGIVPQNTILEEKPGKSTFALQKANTLLNIQTENALPKGGNVGPSGANTKGSSDFGRTTGGRGSAVMGKPSPFNMPSSFPASSTHVGAPPDGSSDAGNEALEETNALSLAMAGIDSASS